MSLRMDAAFFDILQNKSYFYHNDRYFIFDHSPIGISLSDEGSLLTERPLLPLPLDAAFKGSKVKNGKVDHQVFIAGERKYFTKGGNLLSKKMENLLNSFLKPDAVAHDPESTVRIFFKGNKCLRTIMDPNIRKRVMIQNPEKIRNLFKNGPVGIDAAMIIKKRIFMFSYELVWSYNVTTLPANLTEGYPKAFKDLFKGADNEPTISTSLRLASRRLVGHVIEEEWTDSLNKCFTLCLALPFLTCSSINFQKESSTGLHKCEINQFKERHFPQDLTTNNEFVYYDVYW